MTIMSIPITSLEFVCGVCLFDVCRVGQRIKHTVKRDNNLMCTNNIIGGPNIVFHRYHERDVMTIRPTDYEKPKVCKKIIGYDVDIILAGVDYLHRQFLQISFKLLVHLEDVVLLLSSSSTTSSKSLSSLS
jgi:hypothetical protein